MNKLTTLICFSLLIFVSFSQRIHLELGSTLGFKDELHFKPSFDTTSHFTEFHIYDIYVFSRISKNSWGGEMGLGFEKAGNYFIKRFDNSTETKYMNLNRIYFDLSPYFYLIKKSKVKWDLQLGIRNYFNLSRSLFIPETEKIHVWKMGARFTTNYTFKSFIIGLFYEHDLRSDYSFKPNNATFGLRLGVIY